MPIANSWWERGHVAVFWFLPHLTPTSLPSVTNPTCFFVFLHVCSSFPTPHPLYPPTPPHPTPFHLVVKKMFCARSCILLQFCFPQSIIICCPPFLLLRLCHQPLIEWGTSDSKFPFFSPLPSPFSSSNIFLSPLLHHIPALFPPPCSETREHFWSSKYITKTIYINIYMYNIYIFIFWLYCLEPWQQ